MSQIETWLYLPDVVSEHIKVDDNRKKILATGLMYDNVSKISLYFFVC